MSKEMLDNMSARLEYRGGKKQHSRMVADKLWSLQSAINHAYQTVTIETSKLKRFRCLLNPNKSDMDKNSSTLSIPYKAIDLNDTERRKTSEGLVDIGLHNGDVFTWVEDESKWIIVLQDIDEVAYYRAKCQRCEAVAEIGEGYPVYVRGPVETKIDWFKSSNTSFNDLNYSLFMYITKNEETSEFLHRHEVVKIDDRPYKVQAIDWYGGDGIIEVALLEYYKTTVADEGAAVEPEPEPQVTTITGTQELMPYDTATYTINSSVEGVWKVDSKKVSITSQDATTATIEVLTGKSCEFTLSYYDGENLIDKVIVTVNSI